MDPPRLEELHIYSRGGAQCLPREPSHDWLELVEQDKSNNTLADDVVKVRDEDYVPLSKIVLESIHFVIDLLIANGGVKAGDRILRPGYFVDETTLNHLRDCNFTYAEPSEIDGLEENEDIEFAGTGTTRELEVESEVAQEEAASLFYGHSTTLNSVYADLAKKSSVAMIADYTWKLRVKILRTYWELHHGDDDFDTAPPPPAALGAFFCCDGAPAAMLAQLIALDNRPFYLGDEESSMPPNLFVADEGSKSAEDIAFEGWLDELDSKFGFIGKGNDAGSRFKGKFKAFFGGFHACMKLYNCCGTMFGNFVEKFFGAWRSTSARIEWILFPPDPRQLEAEMPQYICAHYYSAFIYLWESRGRTPETLPSATDVHEYMLLRAKTSPYRQAVLVHIRYYEISKLMRMSSKIGKRGSVDLFMTSVRFALTLWATTHAVEYVRLACDFLQFMHCASPAMKELYANELFTRLSASGLPWFTDRIMEGSVKHIRSKLGKIDRPAMEAKMEYASLNIPAEMTLGGVNHELRTGETKSCQTRSRSYESLHENSPLIKSIELIHNRIQLWHPALEPVISSKKGTQTRAKLHSLDLPNGERLNPAVTQCFEIGSDRVLKYFNEYYIQNPFSVQRSEKRCPLFRILATKKDRQVEQQKWTDRAVSVESEVISKAMTSDKVGEELHNVIHALNNSVKIRPPIL